MRPNNPPSKNALMIPTPAVTVKAIAFHGPPNQPATPAAASVSGIPGRRARLASTLGPPLAVLRRLVLLAADPQRGPDGVEKTTGDPVHGEDDHQPGSGREDAVEPAPDEESDRHCDRKCEPDGRGIRHAPDRGGRAWGTPFAHGSPNNPAVARAAARNGAGSTPMRRTAAPHTQMTRSVHGAATNSAGSAPSPSRRYIWSTIRR